MRITRFVSIAVAVLTPAWAGAAAQRPLVPYSTRLQFEPNQGQAGPDVKFLARGRSSAVFLSEDRAVIAVAGARPASVEMRIVRANPHPALEAADPRPGKASYFAGRDPQKWRTGIAQYGQVRYRGVYPGIDAVYYGNEKDLEYDFVVSPGADPRKIRIAFSGQGRMRLDDDGNLVLEAGGREIVQHRPVVYQERGGRREPLEGRYVLDGSEVAIEVPRYDRQRTLVIDPVMTLSTYLGGADDETAAAVAADASGNVYVAGITRSPDFPLTNGAYNNPDTCGDTSYITKIDSAGKNILFSAHLYCGTVRAVTVDASGNVYLAGYSRGGFPTTPNAFGNAETGSAFVTKMSPDGTKLLYSTVIPGNNEDPVAIAVDAAGAAYVAGNGAGYLKTTSGAFQPEWKCGGSSCGFVVKVSPDGGSEAYSTFVQADDYMVPVVGLAVDPAGHAWVTGHTRARNLPTTANAPYTQPGGTGYDDGFVVELNATGTGALLCTYLGGNASYARAIAADNAGNVYVTGDHDMQWSVYPTTPGVYRSNCTYNTDCGTVNFVTKFNAQGKIVYSTLIGSVEGATAIGVDGAGNAVVTGTAAWNFPYPVTADAIKSKTAAEQGADIFITKLNAAGTGVIYSTFFGGTADDRVSSLFVNGAGDIYVTGNTESTDLPLTPGNIQQSKAPGGGKNWDTFVLKLVEPTAPQFTAAGIVNAASFKSGPVAAGEIVTVFGSGIGPDTLAFSGLNGNFFETRVAGTRFLFDGVPAPLIYAMSGQTSLVVPYSVAGKTTTQVVAEYQGRQSAPVTVEVARVSPGLFTSLSSGTGQGAVLNQNYSANSTGNRAKRGEYIMVFLTAGGESGVDGMLAQGAQQHPLPVTAKIAGLDAPVVYAGPSPGCIWGLTQVNLQVPASAPVSGENSLTITIGGVETQASVTVAVQ